MVVANSALAGVFLAAAQLSMNMLPGLCPSSSSGTCSTKVSTELAMQPKGFSKSNLIKPNLASYHNISSPLASSSDFKHTPPKLSSPLNTTAMLCEVFFSFFLFFFFFKLSLSQVPPARPLG